MNEFTAMLKSWDMTGKSRLCCCSGSAQQTSDHIQEDERTNRQTTKTQIYKKKLSSFSPFGKSAKKVKWTISPSTFRYLEKCGTDIGMKKTKIWFDMNFTIIWLFWFTRFILVKSGFFITKKANDFGSSNSVFQNSNQTILIWLNNQTFSTRKSLLN